MSGPNPADSGTLLPDLRIVATENLVPHEHHDGQRLEPLVKRIADDGRLKNPPIVAALNDNRFVVLDGANRVTALKHLTIQHCLVQVVPYEPPFIELQTWHHAITDIHTGELDRQIAQIDTLTTEEVSLIDAKAQLARRVLVCYYVRVDGSVVTLAGSTDLQSRTEQLNQVVSAYLRDGRLHRTNSQNFEELQGLFPNLCALMVFPTYEPAEIMELAGDGERIPPGLTRHIIQGRAMRVNYPLAKLNADESLEAKNEALTAWMQERLDSKRVRYYAESTYLFDE